MTIDDMDGVRERLARCAEGPVPGPEWSTEPGLDAVAVRRADLRALLDDHARLTAEVVDVEADRDRLAATLAEVRAALVEWHRGDDGKALDRALAATPADLATARDARVRAEALRAAADLADRGSERGGWQDDAPLSGDVLPHEVADWLRAEAERIERR